MRVQKFDNQTQQFEFVGVQSRWLRIKTACDDFELEETDTGTLRVRSINGPLVVYPEVSNSIEIDVGERP